MATNIQKKEVTIGDKKFQIEVAGKEVKIMGEVARYFTVEERKGNTAKNAFNAAARKPAGNSNSVNAAAAAAVVTSSTSGNNTPPVVPVVPVVPASETGASASETGASASGTNAKSGGRRRRTRRTRRHR